MVRLNFARRHPWDGWFWALLLALALILVVTAFHRPVSARLAGSSPPASWALILHVWSSAGWLILLGVQAALVTRGRLRWHQYVGKPLLPLAAVVIWSGTMAQVEGDRLRMEARPELLSFTIIPISYLAMFGALAVAAWFARRRPAAHKRLILLATGCLMAGVFIRALGPALFPLLPSNGLTELLINYGGTLLFILIGISYDLATRGRMHRVYGVAVPLMLVTMVAVLAATRTGWLAEVTRRLIAFR
jgi:hypothetical protein